MCVGGGPARLRPETRTAGDTWAEEQGWGGGRNPGQSQGGSAMGIWEMGESIKTPPPSLVAVVFLVLSKGADKQPGGSPLVLLV